MVTVKVIAPFTDVMGLLHNVGESINITEQGLKKYDGFVEKIEVQKNDRKRTVKPRKVKSSVKN